MCSGGGAATSAGGYILVALEVASEPVSSSNVAMVRRAPLTTQPAVPLTASLKRRRPWSLPRAIRRRCTARRPP